MSRRILFVLGSTLLLIALFLAVGLASGQETEDEGDGSPCPSWIVEAWSNSGHADAEAEAFRHWDEDDPMEVPVSCAKCHSEYGYLDFIGADGTEAGVVDAPAAVDSVVSCTVCHNQVAVGLGSVTFPSGVEITGLGESSRCAVCHQGRASKLTVDEAIEGMEPDAINEELGFINIHYFAAASSLYGSEVMGGYEYEGKVYQPSFEHVPGYSTCVGCHDPHKLEIKIDECAACHTEVESVEDLAASVRMPDSMVDYDGDGDVAESIHSELEGMQGMLYSAIQAYAAEVAGTPIVYDSQAYPYFFTDLDGDGEVDEDEANYGNQYASWTPRLLQAAYNFQVYAKDPGAYAHNAAYHAQLMYDSTESLNSQLGEPMTMALHRNPPGHFDGTTEAFRHWDEDGEVPSRCTKCHTSEGLPFEAEHGVQISQEPSTSLACSTCHTNLEDFALYVTDEVEFPSGAVLSFGEGVTSNLCINCHQGRSSGMAVDEAIADAGVGDDEVAEDLGFLNIHYFAAGATLFGAEAHGIYQYEGKEYAGQYLHVPGYETCASCHSAHTLEVKVAECTACHGEFEAVESLRMMAPDYDGDGEDEGVAGEIDTMSEVLLDAIMAYASDVVETPIVYDSHAYPYFFTDLDGDGEVDEDEANYGNQYATWTPALLRAAYNYQYAQKDPGAFAHNNKYVVQALYDSIEAIGGDVSGMTRP